MPAADRNATDAPGAEIIRFVVWAFPGSYDDLRTAVALTAPRHSSVGQTSTMKRRDSVATVGVTGKGPGYVMYSRWLVN